jgi:hypothetical protein
MKTLLIVTFLAVLVSSCGKPSPRKTSVNVDTLANVYAELLVLNERYNISTDSLSSQQYESDYKQVLQNHDYTKERFVSELESVVQSPDEFRKLCDRALANFQLMRRKPSTPGQPGRP